MALVHIWELFRAPVSGPGNETVWNVSQVGKKKFLCICNTTLPHVAFTGDPPHATKGAVEVSLASFLLP
jgi:hypothetical protein